MSLFSRKKDIECPIDIPTRLWMEQAFLWLTFQFGEEKTKNRKVFLPTKDFFSFPYDGSKESLYKTAAIVAGQMEIDIQEINLETFKENIQEIKGDSGFSLYTEMDTEGKGLAAGLYFNKKNAGKYDVFVEESNLIVPERLVAILAHEFSHIKLLGEKRLEENDESLTDLASVIFGLGVFNANAAFQFHQTSASWGYKNFGYLKQREWGFALALFAYYREENEPVWVKFLTPNIISDFKKSQKYILSNTDKIFLDDYTPENEKP